MDRSRRFRSVIAAACVLISLLPGCGENRSDQPKAAVPSSNPAASVPEPAQARPLEFSITPRYEVALFLLDEPSDMLTAEATRVIEQVRPEASIVNDFSEQITKAEFLVELLSTEKYTVPDEKYLGYFGRGMTKDQAKAVQSSKHALILVAFSPRDESLSMVRDMEQIVARLQASTGALVYDGETHEMFTGEAWKARRIDTWDGDVPNVRQQIVLHSYPTGQLTRCVSLGMVKFGYPDVAVNEVPRSFSRSMASLVNLLCHTRVERSDDPTASTVALDIDALKHAELRELMIK